MLQAIIILSFTLLLISGLLGGLETDAEEFGK